MKTRVNNILKTALLVGLTATLLASCGKKNSSGGKKSGGGTVVDDYGIYSTANGAPGNWFEIVEQENPCYQGGQRAFVQIPLNANVNAGAVHVGVSSYGDITVVHAETGQPTMDVYICPRADLTGQGDILQYPVLNTSYECPISEVTAADIVLYGSQVQYQVKFAPIHIPNAGRYSQICQ